MAQRALEAVPRRRLREQSPRVEDERAAVYAALARWVEEGVGSKPFSGGASPDFADVCVFGCLSAIDRTTAFGEIMAETAVKPWYD